MQREISDMMHILNAMREDGSFFFGLCGDTEHYHLI